MRFLTASMLAMTLLFSTNTLPIAVACDGAPVKENRAGETTPHTYYSWERYGYTQGMRFTVFDDNVTLHEKPSASSAVVATLQPLDDVVLLEDAYLFDTEGRELVTLETVNGLSLPWLKVTVNDKTGYLWAGRLAYLSLEEDLGRDGIYEMILVGVRNIDEHSVQDNEIRVYQNKKLLNTAHFMSNNPDINSISTTFISDDGFRPKLDMLDVQFNPDACGVAGANIVMAWNGSAWMNVLVENFVSEAGVFSNDSELIYPSYKGGRPNTIRVKRTEASNWSDRRQKYKTKNVSWTNYVFKQNAFHRHSQ